MAELLKTYLHDHYAGSTFAAELLQTLDRAYAADKLGRFAREMFAEVEADRIVLRSIIEKVGTAGLDLKDVAGWVTEKVSRIKLQQGQPRGLGTFEALEALSLGILGKRSLWATLREIAGTIPWLGEYDFDTLIERANDQFSRAESLRLDIARSTFGPPM